MSHHLHITLRLCLAALGLALGGGCRMLESDPHAALEHVAGGPGDPTNFVASVPTEKGIRTGEGRLAMKWPIAEGWRGG